MMSGPGSEQEVLRILLWESGALVVLLYAHYIDDIRDTVLVFRLQPVCSHKINRQDDQSEYDERKPWPQHAGNGQNQAH